MRHEGVIVTLTKDILNASEGALWEVKEEARVGTLRLSGSIAFVLCRGEVWVLSVQIKNEV